MHATGTDQVDGHFGLVGTFTADGVSAVTSGTLDVNDAHPTQQHQDKPCSDWKSSMQQNRLLNSRRKTQTRYSETAQDFSRVDR